MNGARNGSATEQIKLVKALLGLAAIIFSRSRIPISPSNTPNAR
jgi:hypothetical protein